MQSITGHSKTGCWLVCGWRETSAFPHCSHLVRGLRGTVSAPFLLTLHWPLIPITRTMMSLTRGLASTFPCPIYLVHRDQLADYTTSWPLRTAAQAQVLVQQACGLKRAQDREALLSSQGLRDVDVSDCLFPSRLSRTSYQLVECFLVR